MCRAGGTGGRMGLDPHIFLEGSAPALLHFEFYLNKFKQHN